MSWTGKATVVACRWIIAETERVKAKVWKRKPEEGAPLCERDGEEEEIDPRREQLADRHAVALGVMQRVKGMW